MIAIGSEGQLPDRFFVPLERRHLLVGSDVPNRNPAIAGSSGDAATVRRKRKAVIGTRSRTEREGILVARPDIPKANVCGGGDERLSIGQQRQPVHLPGMSSKGGGFSLSVEWPELDGAAPAATHERLAIGGK